MTSDDDFWCSNSDGIYQNEKKRQFHANHATESVIQRCGERWKKNNEDCKRKKKFGKVSTTWNESFFLHPSNHWGSLNFKCLRFYCTWECVELDTILISLIFFYCLERAITFKRSLQHNMRCDCDLDHMFAIALQSLSRLELSFNRDWARESTLQFVVNHSLLLPP